MRVWFAMTAAIIFWAWKVCTPYPAALLKRTECCYSFVYLHGELHRLHNSGWGCSREPLAWERRTSLSCRWQLYPVEEPQLELPVARAIQSLLPVCLPEGAERPEERRTGGPSAICGPALSSRSPEEEVSCHFVRDSNLRLPWRFIKATNVVVERTKRYPFRAGRRVLRAWNTAIISRQLMCRHRAPQPKFLDICHNNLPSGGQSQEDTCLIQARGPQLRHRDGSPGGLCHQSPARRWSSRWRRKILVNAAVQMLTGF